MWDDSWGGTPEKPQTEIQRIEKSVLAFCGQAGLFALDSGLWPENCPAACLPAKAESSPVIQEKTGPAAHLSAQSTQDEIVPTAADGLRPVIAAVSGGADSMALLRLLLAFAPECGLRVSACHVNHGLRGKAADADEAFVRAECKKLGVPLRVYRAAELGLAPPAHAGEDWARRLRYTCFAKAAAAAGQGALVATAHTLTDQAETLLFRLARGTGVHGAAGIRPRRGIYIRPLLCLARADTERYCNELGQAFVTDETNLSDAYARNRLRHDALPALRAANAAAEENMGRFCEKMARQDAYFSQKAEMLLQRAACGENGWRLDVLQQAEPLVLEAAAHSLISPVRDAETVYIRLLCETIRHGGALQLRPGVRFAAKNGVLRCQTEQKTPQPLPRALPVCPGEYTLFGGYRLKIELQEAQTPFFLEKTQSVHKKDLKNLADYAKITLLPFLRTRMPGDTFRPAGRGVTKTLKKLLNEAHIPPEERGLLPVIAAGSEVLWLWNEGFAEGLAPDETTTKLLCITQLERAEDEKNEQEYER